MNVHNNPIKKKKNGLKNPVLIIFKHHVSKRHHRCRRKGFDLLSQEDDQDDLREERLEGFYGD